jgi:RNA polymerase sigma factor (sigma-70 family)
MQVERAERLGKLVGSGLIVGESLWGVIKRGPHRGLVKGRLRSESYTRALGSRRRSDCSASVGANRAAVRVDAAPVGSGAITRRLWDHRGELDRQLAEHLARLESDHIPHGTRGDVEWDQVCSCGSFSAKSWFWPGLQIARLTSDCVDSFWSFKCIVGPPNVRLVGWLMPQGSGHIEVRVLRSEGSVSRSEMQARTVEPRRIEPLTHRGTDGKTYRRSPELESQIVEALSLEQSLLRERVSIERHTEPGYLKEECLVYLIRRFLRNRESDLASHLMNCLATRIARRVHNQVFKSLHWSLVDDCSQDVMFEVTRLLTDLASDRDDFAQVRFGPWLQRVTFNALRPYLRSQKRERATEIDVEEVEKSNGKKHPLKDGAPLPDELVIRAETHRLHENESQKLLARLKPEEREAYLMRYRDGMEIENQDPHVMTISKHFGRSSKTIHKWLKDAERKLQELQGGQQ